jgi:hypothetical protein
MDLTFYTVDGSITLEQYVARVTTAENGQAAPAALRAQAIAARTFVLRAMRDDALLGTYKKPVPNGEHFQVYKPTASPRAATATAETAGLVCRYQGELTICNYVAGAFWTAEGQPGKDPTHTEKWVTYNEGKTGAAVQPSPISHTGRPDNRGCMSQNGADWLARHGRDHLAILRYFYGADLAIDLRDQPKQPPFPGSPSPAPAPAPRSTSAPLAVLAALAVAFIGDSQS